jgi:hypothetical protein
METISLKQRNSGLKYKSLWFLMATMFFVWGLPENSNAHCDSFDGPVIQEALHAIETGRVDPLLKWVDANDEKEIISLFDKTVALKSGDPEVFKIVKKHFLETLVRIHRESEGAPFTGLKPAGSVTPVVKMADQSIENGDVKTLSEKLMAHLQKEVQTKFAHLQETERKKDQSVEEGRKYVAAYVEYTHFLEAVHDVIAGKGGHAEHN